MVCFISLEDLGAIKKERKNLSHINCCKNFFWEGQMDHQVINPLVITQWNRQISESE